MSEPKYTLSIEVEPHFGATIAPANLALVKPMVTKVEGPYNEKDELQESIDKSTEYYYYATLNVDAQKVNPKEVKWAVALDDNEADKTSYLFSGKEIVENRVRIAIKIEKEIEKFKIYAYTTQLPDKDVFVEVKVKIILGYEFIYIVGTEQHSASYGNKMMFPAQAIREVKECVKKDDYRITIIIFKDGFNSEELKVIEKSAKKHYSEVNFVKINSVKELINYINNGNKKIGRETIKIKTIKIFAHGLASVLDFGLDGNNRQSQQFKISHVSQLKKDIFSKDAKLYSYACRTGNADTRPIVSVNPMYKYDDNWLELVKPSKSLAQKLADHLNVTVYAYLKRSLYTSTWNDKGDEKYQKDYKEIDDESINGWGNLKKWVFDWDEALWHPNGAYAPPTTGETPYGLPSGMYIFKKGVKPSEK